MSEVDIQAIAKQVTDRFIDRMASQEMPDADFDENASILFNFNNIAVTLLKDEPGLEMPGATQVIPIDEGLTEAIISMFAEGICHAMIRCAEMGLTGDPKKSILQDMALEVYNQAKQIVACTYGQENTPSFQFSPDQQVSMINQASEGHLMFFIGEYEKKNGPIAFDSDEEDDGDFLSHGQMEPTPQLPVAPVQPQAPIQPQAIAPAQAVQQTPQMPAVSNDEREKFAAISLLLSAVSSAQREKIFRGIPDKGRAWVEYYSHVPRIPQELNMERVQQRLSQLRNQLKGGSKDKGASVRPPSPVARLADRYDEHRLLSLVQDERPDILFAVRREYRQEQVPVQYWRYQEPTSSAQDSTSPAEQEVRLPPRIEEILARFLARRLDSNTAMSAKEKYPNAH
jgi:hypothetical protein